MLPRDTIEQVIHSAKIEEIVGEVVTLKRQGANLSGLCPFHNEKTPSFVVSPGKNIFKCFGCGKGGDALHFVMENQHKTFIEAVKYIAGKYSIPIIERELSTEEKQAAERLDRIRTLYNFAATFYQSSIPDTDAYTYISKRLSANSIGQWRIGFAPEGWDNFTTYALQQGWTEDLLIDSKLTKKSDKNGKLFDFFRNRIIFPITDRTGQITSFAGRVLPGSEEAKYINLAENDLYHKGTVLYGYHAAVRAIREHSNVYIVEGYTDVIRMHEHNIYNVVASSGTAFTDEQIALLKKESRKITFLGDGDKAGQTAVIKNAKKAVKAGMFAYVVPLSGGKDPADAWFDQEEATDFINKNTTDFINFFAAMMLEKAGADPMLKNDAIGEIADLLVSYDKTTRDLYTANITKQTKLKSKLISDKIKDLEASITTFDDDNASDDDREFFLPEGVDVAMYEKYGFFQFKNEYYFKTKQGNERMSNFIMLPIFHINTINESKRIYELINKHNYKVVVDLDMQEMTSLQAFQRNVEGRGNFLFWGAQPQFSKVKLMLYEQTQTCTEIKVLGWQKEGFWAWSNGIITDNGFEEVDEYGVVNYDEQTYFIPAFSKIYLHDKSIFIDERKFKYIPTKTTLPDWSNMFIRVFGNNAMIGISFWVATLFRDIILRTFKNFPILNLFGPKGTGKSQMAVSLCYLFGDSQVPYNIHNGTKPGLAEHLQQFNNAFAWVDEYKNNIEYDKIETLKAIYDAIGRNRLNMDKGRKKERTNVNAAVILSGQEMPTADVALFSRVIFLQFNQTEYSDAEKHHYDQLKNTEAKGLSHLSSSIVMLRKYFEENFYNTYTETFADFNEHFADHPVEDRILRSMVSIVAAWRTISAKIQFPFTYPELLQVATKSVESQNAQVSKSNEIGMFWNILESLFDENLIEDKFHFRIDYCDSIKTKHTTLNLNEATNVLKFKYNAIYSSYAQLARRQGVKPLPSDTLQYYLKTHKTFIGIQDQCVFTEKRYNPAKQMDEEKSQNTSAMCFHYEKLGINLERNDVAPNYTTPISYPPHPTDKTNPYYNIPNELPY